MAIQIDTAAAAPAGKGEGSDPARRLEILPEGHPDRASLQGFISDAYLRAYGAHVHAFAQHLVGLRRPDGAWAAGVGFSLAGNRRLYVEQYLDRPVEMEISEALKLRADRERVVEVGNLAATGPGAARCLILRMASLLHGMGCAWVVFTATQSLLNSFSRLDLSPVSLARADPARLPDGGREWGNYYDHHPRVMAADIASGFAEIKAKSPAVSEWLFGPAVASSAAAGAALP